MGVQINNLAVVSLVLGIVAIPCGCFCGVIGLFLGLSAAITGVIALKQIQDSQGVQSGREMAIGGVALGAFTVIMAVAFTALFVIQYVVQEMSVSML